MELIAILLIVAVVVICEQFIYRKMVLKNVEYTVNNKKEIPSVKSKTAEVISPAEFYCQSLFFILISSIPQTAATVAVGSE